MFRQLQQVPATARRGRRWLPGPERNGNGAKLLLGFLPGRFGPGWQMSPVQRDGIQTRRQSLLVIILRRDKSVQGRASVVRSFLDQGSSSTLAPEQCCGQRLALGLRSHPTLVSSAFASLQRGPLDGCGQLWNVVADELTRRRPSGVARLGNNPKIRSLKDVIVQMGRLYDSVEATAEPDHTPSLPEWMISALKDQLHLSDQEISKLSEQQGQEQLMAYWSRTSES